MVGARPQFIKAAPVSRALRARSISESLVHTGQHYDANMSDVFFRQLGLTQPNHHLGIGSGTHGEQTGRMLAAVESMLLAEPPDLVMVYGDTNSTLAAALAAAKLQIPVAHVEAGLRSYNRAMPEEINRILTDHVSELMFAPTDDAVANLSREGMSEERVHLVGDVMYDAALLYAQRARDESRILQDLALEPGEYILATVHRAENTDRRERLESIFTGLAAVARETPVVMPVHPRTRRALAKFGIDGSELRLIDPLGYLDMIELERHARLIATDSGGVQKEAYFYRVPCVTLREETEWVELVETGWNVLVPPTRSTDVFQGIMANLDLRGREVVLYGGGTSSERIGDILVGALRSS